MALDPKLRELLDTLSEEPAKVRPREDREYLVSVLRRLNIKDVPRANAPAMPAAARHDEAAYAREEELRALREQQERDEAALHTIQAERDALAARQQELEDRLARLEASGRGSGLTYIDEGPVEEPEPVVEFTRVDFPPKGEDLMEFESLGTTRPSAFSQPDEGAWEAGAAWDTAEEPGWGSEGNVDWDEEPAAGWDEPTPAPEPIQEPALDDAWESEPEDARSWEEVEPAHHPEGAQAETSFDDLDDRTKSDLAELEAQLAELEKELAKRDQKARGGQ